MNYLFPKSVWLLYFDPGILSGMEALLDSHQKPVLYIFVCDTRKS